MPTSLNPSGVKHVITLRAGLLPCISLSGSLLERSVLAPPFRYAAQGAMTLTYPCGVDGRTSSEASVTAMRNGLSAAIALWDSSLLGNAHPNEYNGPRWGVHQEKT